MKTRKIFSFVILLLILTIKTVNAEWQQTAMTTGNVTSLAATQTHIFVSSNNVYSTIDNGATWINTGISSNDICANLGRVFALALYTVYSTTNNGVNWSPQNISYADGLACITVDNSNVYAGSIHYGMALSTNNGSNWSPVPGINGSIYNISAKGNLVFAERQGILYRSTNLGSNWIQTPLPINSINAIIINGSNVYAATDNNGVYISTDNGVTWNQSSLNNQTVKSLAVSGNNVFAGTQTQGVYYSSNSGTNWVLKNVGLTNLSGNALLINGDYIYLGTNGSGVWKRPLSEVLAVNNISTEIPKEYSLFQNYPNPFNPVTNIKFSLPVSGYTTLTIYDITGRSINTLVNEHLKAGTYETDFDGSNIASGIYLYTLTSGDFTETNKMILVK